MVELKLVCPCYGCPDNEEDSDAPCEKVSAVLLGGGRRDSGRSGYRILIEYSRDCYERYIFRRSEDG